MTSCAIALKSTVFKNLKIFPRLDFYFIYDELKGIYVSLKGIEIEILIRRMLSQIEFDPLEYPPYIKSILANFKIDFRISNIGEPISSKEILVFSNGILNLSTGQFGEWSPHYFVVTRLPFPYDPSARCPQFLQFIHEFSEHYEDRVQLIRSFLHALLFSRVDLQVFLYLLGPAATGKSILARIATALVGIEGTLTTSLKTLHSDQFELPNIRGKKLILINDTEYYRGDMSILKQIVGGVRGRIQYVQGAFEILPEVMIVGNYPLGVKDTSNAILRRMITLKASHRSKSRIPLIFYSNEEWKGPLGQELPGIMNWVLDIDRSEAEGYLLSPEERVPSFSEVRRETLEILNPLAQWVSEEIEVGQGSYIGFRSLEGQKGFVEASRRKALYPAYTNWVQKQGGIPLSHKNFSPQLNYQ